MEEESNTMTSAGASSSEALPVALRWVLLHSTTSNSELAQLSNVCKHWRRIVSAIILEQATWKIIPSAPLLLLPSMVSELISDVSIGISTADKDGAENSQTQLQIQDQDQHQNQNQNQKQTRQQNLETYCACWFGPEGVQLLDLDQEEDCFQEEMPEPFAPGGGISYPASDDDGTRKFASKSSENKQKQPGNRKVSQRSKSPMVMNIQHRAPRLEQIPSGPHTWARGHGPNTKVSFTDQGIMVSHEWRGYRKAIEVLRPFGYAESFVEQVLSTAQAYLDARVNEIPSDTKRMQTASDDITKTTFAVRGATIARPEGYCLCWEPPSQLPPMEWSRTSSHDEEVVQSIRWQERQRKLQQWKEWRRELQLTVLPQVLARNNAPPDCSNAVVQCLNSDEKNAVRLMTPLFACGPICEPVTIFVVGIATEDGCFCSGLNHRFELGHLYPNNAIAELSEMSPICMATDTWECSESSKPSFTPGQASPLEQHLSHDSDDESEDDYSDDSSSDFDQMEGTNRNSRPQKTKGGWLSNCACIFQDNSNPCGFGREVTGNAKRERKDDDMSETAREDDDGDDGQDDGDGQEEAERILRGSRIPGVWHCYTAVFDGTNSTLRVDGVQEVLTAADEDEGKKMMSSSQSIHSSASKSPSSFDNSSTNARRRVRRAMLDGLTIGSDHCFDMTLCFGQGSGGEGEGAIAEIAVFSGRLDPEDLKVLETQLMNKHGIPIPSQSRETLAMEDEYTRNAHSLYCQLPPEAAQALRHKRSSSPLAFEQNTIPLRVMAKHRSVAWHQYNSVTGEELRIKRIGSRSGGSSSDW